MTQSVALAAAQTANSADITIAPGASAVLELFAGGGARIPQAVTVPVYTVANSVEKLLGGLHVLVDNGRMVVGAGCTVRIKRPDISAWGVDVGVTVDQ